MISQTIEKDFSSTPINNNVEYAAFCQLKTDLFSYTHSHQSEIGLGSHTISNFVWEQILSDHVYLKQVSFMQCFVSLIGCLSRSNSAIQYIRSNKVNGTVHL